MMRCALALMRLGQSSSIQKKNKATGKMKGGAKHRKLPKTAKNYRKQLLAVEEKVTVVVYT